MIVLTKIEVSNAAALSSRAGCWVRTMFGMLVRLKYVGDVGEISYSQPLGPVLPEIESFLM